MLVDEISTAPLLGHTWGAGDDYAVMSRLGRAMLAAEKLPFTLPIVREVENTLVGAGWSFKGWPLGVK